MKVLLPQIETIQESFEAHAASQSAWLTKAKRTKQASKKGKEKASSDEDSDNNDDEDTASDSDVEEAPPKAKASAGIRKVRIGTFEDSGKCKG